MAKSVGFIGLGIMGSGISRRMLETGHFVMGYDLDLSKLDTFASLGGAKASSIKELVEKSDIICSSLPNPSIVQDVYLGENGVLEHARSGQIIIEFSTVDPNCTRKIYKEGLTKEVKVLDCPVSGGRREAAAGTLTFMVGGDKEVFDEQFDFLKDLSSTIHYTGPSGAGNIVKLINNVIVLGSVMMISESMVLGAKAGVDVETLYNILCKSGATSLVLEKRFPRVLKRDFEASFALDLAKKDVGLALDMAKAIRFPTPNIATVFELFEICSSKGLGNKDSWSVITFFEDLAKIEVKGKN